MNPFTRSFLFAVAAPIAAVLAQDPADKPADYVAHEWGTFTSMVGSDGIVLEGLQREEEALPRFVHDLLRITEAERLRSKMPSSRVTHKMETPVIYFHTDTPLRVRVDVWFSQGLMTQFYPLPAVVTPELPTMQAARVDMSKIDGSALQWNVDLVPRTERAPREIPAVAATEPWAIARQVHAAWVRTANEGALPEAEHYLFYRGLGRWQPKLALALDGDGAVKLCNNMRDALPFVAVLELGPQGGRFAVGRPLDVGATQRLSWADQELVADRALLAGRLGEIGRA